MPNKNGMFNIVFRVDLANIELTTSIRMSVLKSCKVRQYMDSLSLDKFCPLKQAKLRIIWCLYSICTLRHWVFVLRRLQWNFKVALCKTTGKFCQGFPYTPQVWVIWTPALALRHNCLSFCLFFLMKGNKLSQNGIIVTMVYPVKRSNVKKWLTREYLEDFPYIYIPAEDHSYLCSTIAYTYTMSTGSLRRVKYLYT